MKARKFAEKAMAATSVTPAQIDTPGLSAGITVYNAGDTSVCVSIRFQFMEPADLRAAAKVFKRMADRLDAGV